MEGYNNLSPEARKDLESPLIYTAKLWCGVLLAGELGAHLVRGQTGCLATRHSRRNHESMRSSLI